MSWYISTGDEKGNDFPSRLAVVAEMHTIMRKHIKTAKCDFELRTEKREPYNSVLVESGTGP